MNKIRSQNPGFLFLSMLLLTACQYDTDKEDNTAKVQKKNGAASYNVQLGLAYLKQGDRPRAKKKLLIAHDLAPSMPETNSALAYYFESTGDMKEATNYYKKALSLAPDSGAQLNNYGTFLCRAGQYKESEAYFLKAVKDVQYINTAGAYENAGLCATEIPDLPRAVHFFKKALQQDPTMKQSLYELVSIELKQEQPEMALNYLQRYSELVSNDATLLSSALLAANKAGKNDLEEKYRLQLSQLNHSTDSTGVK